MFSMEPLSSVMTAPDRATNSIKDYLAQVGSDLLTAFPPAEQLSAGQRRGIIARYSAVLEGNFIYWMTGAYIAAQTEEARNIIMENLHEEVRDCHPGMLHRFEIAADACPDAADVQAVYPSLIKVRLFIGRLQPAPIVAMMAFFENFIMRFMPILEEYAMRQGSTENEYTQVHGVCDVVHSEELYHALEAEIAAANDPRDIEDYLFEGVDLLAALIRDMAAEPAVSA
jgi:hypothetical protein